MKTLLLLGAIALSINSFSQVPTYVPTNGLIGWWGFNGNANDESGNGNDGIVTDATLTVDQFANSNSAYNFDYAGYSNGALDDMIYVPDNSAFNSSEITVSCWFKPTAWSYPGNPGSSAVFKRVETGYDNPPGEFWYIVFGDDGSLAGGVIDDGQNGLGISSAPGAITLNDWHFVSLTYDGQNEYLYLNGTLVGSQVGTNALSTLGISGLSFGVSFQANGYWRPFNGDIDNSGLWNRALTECEIQDLYDGSLGNCCTQNPITAQPTDQSETVGNNAVFSFSDALIGATYQWQMDAGTGYTNLSNAGQFLGSDTQTLNVSSVTMGNNNTLYRCIVTESSNCQDTTDVATLNVINNVGIDEIESLVSVHPNPTKDAVTLSVKADLVGTGFTITDNAGRIVLTDTFKSTEQKVNLSVFDNGVYFIRTDKESQPVKIIKQ